MVILVFQFSNLKIEEIWVPSVMVTLYELEGLVFRVWGLGFRA